MADAKRVSFLWPSSDGGLLGEARQADGVVGVGSESSDELFEDYVLVNSASPDEYPSEDNREGEGSSASLVL